MEPPICLRCGQEVFLREESEHTGYCNQCAQLLMPVLQGCMGALEDALERMMETHGGSHGPCRNNNCADCKYAFKKSQEALAKSRMRDSV